MKSINDDTSQKSKFKKGIRGSDKVNKPDFLQPVCQDN